MNAPGSLVYLYGPPAVGKLTVAWELQAQTSFRLFHNHLTVNAIRSVFDFGSGPFTDVVHRVRLDVFETAARYGIDVIFTNNSVWAVPDGRHRFASFALEARRRVERAGGRVLFVQLHAPAEDLETRIDADSRRQHGKLLERERLRELIALLDPSPLHPDDLSIDTSTLQPSEAAAIIANELQRRRAPS